MQNKFVFNNNSANMTFSSYMSKVFIYVALGLLVSGGISYLIGNNTQLLITILSTFGGYSLFIIAIAEIAVAIFFSSKLMTMSKSTAYICYFLYAALTGLTFSTIFAIYSIVNITMAFISTTGLFICMAVFGNSTSLNLSKASSYLSFGLIGIIIATLLNTLIFKSSTADLLISYVAIIIFLVLIAYDTQKLRSLYNSGLSDGDLYEKLLIFGSFQLYLDFINIFLRLLQIFSRRRD